MKKIGVRRGSPARAVVFAERIPTLRWLAEHLPGDLALPVGAVEMLHGGLSDEEQQRIVDEFKQAHSAVRVLVTGDVASEGVNLHAQCHELVHYDIPWSLIRIEQRNGRIDRYGQRSRPQITTLLLDPTTETFAGDIRVLQRVVEREHEAHRALGDVASLMGRYDVQAEEEDIRRVLAGEQSLDDVVRTVDEVLDSDDLGGFLERLSTKPTTDPNSVSGIATESAAETTSLYPDDISYLDEALHAAFVDPTGPVNDNGVAWRDHRQHGTAELVPPRDLVQRLEVLPQSYLAERRVTEKLLIATTVAQGGARLAAALQDDSGSSWPDAHYLAPLDPLLEWASDRALASLGRNEIFAVRGGVEDPTVLLLGTLTNRRGQVVAMSWLTVAFPVPGDHSFAPVQPHASAGAALATLGWTAQQANPGPVSGVGDLTALVGPAVRHARAQMQNVFAAAEAEVSHRVADWSQRLDHWDATAADLATGMFGAQLGALRSRRVTVEQERELVEAMQPDRQLVRALLIVVPPDTGRAAE